MRDGVVFTGEQYQRQTINGRLLVIAAEVSAFVLCILLVFSLLKAKGAHSKKKPCTYIFQSIYETEKCKILSIL